MPYDRLHFGFVYTEPVTHFPNVEVSEVSRHLRVLEPVALVRRLREIAGKLCRCYAK